MNCSLMPGHILVPLGPYLYCLRVNKVLTRDEDPDVWWCGPMFPIYLECTRYDLDGQTREPIFRNPHRMHITYVREITPDVFREEDCRWDPGVKYLRRWRSPIGQQELF